MTGRATGGKIVAISGGVGGAKLSLGLLHLLGERLTVIVNTGDDFEHVGLHVSPDVDTALYTLADLVNPETGWGRRDETWTFMAALARLGGPDWFRLGDGDLALHVERTRRLKAGESLTSITEDIRRRLGIAACVLPMSDDPVRTLVETDAGVLGFQDYFVRLQCKPQVRSLRFAGAEVARSSEDVLAALADPALVGIVICPSNPYFSVDPVLALPGLRAAIEASSVPVVAVSPIVGGRAIKGPAAKIMAELGIAPDAANVARHYRGLIDGFVLDREDAASADGVGMPALVVNTMMRTLDDRMALARDCLDFCARLTREVRA